MADAQPVEVKTGSRLDLLVKKYSYQPGAATPRQQVQVAFDSRSVYEQDKDQLRRIGKAPQTGTGTSTGDILAEQASIDLELAALAEESGELNVKLSNLFGRDKIYEVRDYFRLAYNSVVRDRNTVREIKIKAAARKGNATELLIDKIAHALEKQYQKAVQGKALAEALQTENVAHMKTLDRKLVESLRKGYYGSADYAAAEKEVGKLEKELSDIEQVLAEYERDVKEARTASDIEKIQKVTDEMSQVLDIKHGVLDGRLSAEGVVSEIRRRILDSAEAVQSAKGATAASKVNYRAINALIDSYSELEIKYRHAKEDMIPVFRMQGKISARGKDALLLRDTLMKAAGISQRMLESNAKMVIHLARETFALLQAPVYDPVKANAVEEQLRTYMTELNQQKMAWAEQVQTIKAVGESPHYAQHR